MNRNRAVLSIVVLFAIGCIPFGDVWFHFQGVVRDAAGAPIDGARVQIFVNGKPPGGRSVTTTDREGKYEIFENSCPCDFDFELRVTKVGYRPYTLKLRGRKANALKQQDVILQRETG